MKSPARKSRAHATTANSFADAVFGDPADEDRYRGAAGERDPDGLHLVGVIGSIDAGSAVQSIPAELAHEQVIAVAAIDHVVAAGARAESADDGGGRAGAEI